MRLVIFGAGYSGREIASRLAARAGRIAGTGRTSEALPVIAAAGAAPVLFDGHAISADLAAELAAASHIIVSIPPGEAGDPLLPLVAGRLAGIAPELRWIGYLSTVGVYGDRGGGWVDEESECRPVSKRSLARLAAEEGWAALGADAGVPTALIRLSGIYGPGRNAFLRIAEGTARRVVKPGQVFNRVHVADIAGAVALLAHEGLGGIYNITDDLPAPPQDVIVFAAGLMGAAPPPEIDFEEAGLGPMARSFYAENKRVSNARLKAAGYALDYPDYRTALEIMWRKGEW